MMFHVKHEGWAHTTSDLSPDQVALLVRYERLLATKGAALGLVSAADVPRIRERHLIDGLRGSTLLPDAARRIVDLGSGGGVPGIPIAVSRPDVELVLAEVRRARAAFLELVVDELALTNVIVHAGSVDQLAPGFDACLARAFAPPTPTWQVAKQLLRAGGVLLYWAGERFDLERDVPEGAAAQVATGPLAYGGPVVIMSPR